MAILIWIAFYGSLAVVAVALSVIIQRLRPPRETDYAATYRLRARMKRLARPTLLLTPAKAPGFSKVGGLPELPAGLDLPMGENGPAAFVAQIDIAAFRKHGGFDWLPEDSRLYLFYDDDLNGAAIAGQVVYSREPAGPERQRPAPLAKNRAFAERRVGFMRFTSLPSWDWLDEDWPSANIDWEGWELAKDADFGDEIEHRIGGYPSEIQGGQMALECEHLHRGLTRDYSEPVPDAIRRASWQWRLLLQIDSDPALNMNWWDAGRLYVFVRARDAKVGDFSKMVTISQTH